MLCAQELSVTDSSLVSWDSIEARGNPATITPVLSSIHSAVNTIGAAPTALTTAGSSSISSPTEASISAGEEYYPCDNLAKGLGAFCMPTNSSVVYVGTTYYVTWDYRYFDGMNTSIYIMADYVNTTGGKIAFQSPVTAAGTGFIAWTIQKEWLQGQSSNNITLYINEIEEPGSPPVSGPTVMVAYEPASYYRQPTTKAPSGQSLYIALPTVFIFIVLCIFGGCYLNRKHRQIGIGSVMGRRKGYGVGKSRSQRLRLRKKEDPIQLQEQVLGADGRYHDAPVEEEQIERPRGRRPRIDFDLGSLVRSPTQEGVNYFRDEMRRQEHERS